MPVLHEELRPGVGLVNARPTGSSYGQLALAGFPDAGSYMGAKSNIGL